MVVCPQCGREVPAEAQRCPHDGTPLAAGVTSGGTIVRGSGLAHGSPSSPALRRTPSRLDDYMAGPVDVQPGTMIGEYEVTGKLGEGGMGSVYAAVHPIIGKKVAIKILGEHLASNREVVRRFVAEARAVNQIGHRNIVDAFGFGQLPDGREYYVMEYLAGRSLEDDLIERGTMATGEIVEMMGQVLDALQAAHDKGIFHRDLKPDNIFLVSESRGYSVKLLDFGIAKLSGDESALTKTRTGVAMGTPDYMSPEQCRGTNIDHRTDLYAIGVILYRLFTGELPFAGESAVELLYKHCSEAPPAPSSKAPVSPAFEDVISRCLAKDPDQRFASARELSQALEDALEQGNGVRPGAVARPSRAITPTPPPDDDVDEAPSAAPAIRAVPEATAQVAPFRPKPRKAPVFALAAVAAGLLAVGAALFVVLGRGGDDAVPAAPELGSGEGPTAPEQPVRPEQPAVAPTADAAVEQAAMPPDAAAAAPVPQTGSLVVETNVPGAVVSLDGRRVGRGKRVAVPELEPGRYELTIERRRFETERRTVEVVAGEEARLVVSLERKRPSAGHSQGGSSDSNDGKKPVSDDRPDPLTDKDGTIDVFDR